MSNSRDQKIDSLIQSVQERVDNRRIEYSNEPQINWNSFSPESQEVLEHFGIDAPHLLNVFCCTVEDALIEVCDRLKEAKNEIKALEEQLNSTES